MNKEKNNFEKIVEMHGLNIRKLAKIINIPYSTLRFLTETSPEKWPSEKVLAISNGLNMSTNDLMNKLNDKILVPFVKCSGDKKYLLPELQKYVPKEYNNYFEPFVGGGALFLKIKPKKAIISDLNKELMDSWQIIKDDVYSLIFFLKYLEKNDSEKLYMEWRSADRDGRIIDFGQFQRALRFIYLNKAGYKHLWRLNNKGQNNVPYGNHKKLNLQPENMELISEYLRNNQIELKNNDYKNSLKLAEKGDFVYLDPPHIPYDQTNEFKSYQKDAFGLIQQKELVQTITTLFNKGVKVMISNSDVSLIDELYSDTIFKVHHTINKEVIITTY